MSISTTEPSPPELAAGADPSDVPIGPLVRRFFGALDAAGLPWAVLRGADGLPDFTRYDIDLLIRPGDEDRVEGELRAAAAAGGWALIRTVDKFGYRCCMLVSPGPRRRFLPVDLFGGCHHRFYPIADGEFGLNSARVHADGVRVVAPGFGAVVTLLKELMRHPNFKENSREEVRRGVIEDPESFKRAASGILSEGLTARLMAACEHEHWTEVEAMAAEIRREVSAGSSKCSPTALRFFATNVRHILAPPMSGLIVMLGPDGAGKSTIADRTGERLYKNPYKISRRYEYNFRILPELKTFKRKIAALLGRPLPPPKPVEPGTYLSGMNREHGALKGSAYVTYYALDFILGRLQLRKLRGQGAVLIFARYFHDYYYQRGYGNVPRWYLRFLEFLVPRPDQIFYLHRDPEEIYRGKPELDLAEIQRQQQVIRELVHSRSNAMVIDAGDGIEATVTDVCERIHADFLRKHGVS